MTQWSKPWNTQETVVPEVKVETPAPAAVVEPVVEEAKKTTKKTSETPAE
jgi:ABC-type sulfate transport system substrate-binding protein